MRRKVKHRFKVGELVEQVRNLHGNENKLCRVVEVYWVYSSYRVRHLHLGEKGIAVACINDFKKVPKLKRILLELESKSLK